MSWPTCMAVFHALLRAGVEILAAQHPATQYRRGHQPEADENLDKQLSAQTHVSAVFRADSKLVADAAYTDDQLVPASCGQLFTNLTDMHVDTAIVGGQGAPQGLLTERVLIYHFARISHQRVQHTELGAGQLQVVAGIGDAALLGIQAGQPYLDRRVRIRATTTLGATQYCPQAGGQFTR